MFHYNRHFSGVEADLNWDREMVPSRVMNVVLSGVAHLRAQYTTGSSLLHGIQVELDLVDHSSLIIAADLVGSLKITLPPIIIYMAVEIGPDPLNIRIGVPVLELQLDEVLKEHLLLADDLVLSLPFVREHFSEVLLVVKVNFFVGVFVIADVAHSLVGLLTYHDALDAEHVGASVDICWFHHDLVADSAEFRTVQSLLHCFKSKF